jgi:OFA family oxalate/formate antiporter-like MFS transporter
MGALTMVTSYYSFVGVIAILGLCYGGFLALMAPLTAELFGTKNLGVNFGIMFLTVAIAAYVGPLLAAVVKQANHGDYTQAFSIAALINLGGLILFGAFTFFRKRRAASKQITA